MADEIKVRVKTTLANGYLADLFDPGEVSITQTTGLKHCPVVDIGTSEEDISFGDISAANIGYCAMRNLDTTNYVDIGPKSGGAMVGMLRLKPGEPQSMRLVPGVTLRAVANTAACKVQFSFYQT
ncbi:MAG: hypothetical protein EHM42_10765 [Planctomycetaceae bacterium]|nr:MAG: hypothetical protein EHM42_15000 [Planctomycetaceae bacterium]RPI81352.1 MAG: hypothetical protein EHM42_10765 [Planctomycetaceae bacterium]